MDELKYEISPGQRQLKQFANSGLAGSQDYHCSYRFDGGFTHHSEDWPFMQPYASTDKKISATGDGGRIEQGTWGYVVQWVSASSVLKRPQNPKLIGHLPESPAQIVKNDPRDSAVLQQRRAGEGSVLLEALSRRELVVLKLLQTELSGPEISAHLCISINTFRTHTKNLYSKLRVNSRIAVIRRAMELNIL